MFYDISILLKKYLKQIWIGKQIPLIANPGSDQVLNCCKTHLGNLIGLNPL